MAAKKSALGKGLSALLDNTTPPSAGEKPTQKPPVAKEVKPIVGGIAKIPISQIEANPFQPRTNFDKEAIEELAASIKEHGIIQPITVRKLGANKYQIISGERRFRASQIAGLEQVPVYVRIANDQTLLEMAIIENIQREDLNALEIAISYQRLIDECEITQEKVGERVGKSRASVTNYLRLLNLPTEIQIGVRDKQISMGHARALLSFEADEEKIKVYRQIIDHKLSVRAVEEIAKNKKDAISYAQKPKKNKLTLREKRLQEDLSFHFNSKIKIAKKEDGKGVISIPFTNEEHLEKILALLDK
ncbi:MAG: ParB/RepB/Spo0J family partition protein [Flavobacteriales bacterium]|jgi:ParB family chromosome partitioning protein|nr:ParB/RepB/Spo0J family partition protein [Flavobacteriales bacterium]